MIFVNIYLDVLLLTDPFTDVESSHSIERSQIGQAAQTAVVSNSFSSFTKDITGAEECKDTYKCTWKVESTVLLITNSYNFSCTLILGRGKFTDKLLSSTFFVKKACV